MNKKERGSVSIVSVFLFIIIIALAAVAVYLYMDLRKAKAATPSDALKVPTTENIIEEEEPEEKTDQEIIKDRISMLNGGSDYSTNLTTKTYAVPVNLRSDNGDIHLYLGTDNKLYVEYNDGIDIPGASDSNGAIKGLDLGLQDIVMVYEAEFGGRADQKSAVIILKTDGYFYALRNILNSNYAEEKIDVENPVSCYIPATGAGKTVIIDSKGNSTEIE